MHLPKNLANIITRSVTGIILAVFAAFTIIKAPYWFFLSIVILIGFLLLYVELPQLTHGHPIVYLVIACFYIVLPLSFITYIQLNSYYIINSILISAVSIFDTMSYIGGNMLGVHKLCPTISPGKTWEGLCTGFIFLSIFFTGIAPNLYHALLYSMLVSMVALSGDLGASYLKRRAQLKDSSHLLPGHGGLLDRLDGLLATSWLFFIAYIIFNLFAL